MKDNFYLSLRTQYQNLGDYLIAQATIDFLSKKGKITLDIRNVPSKYIQIFTFPEDIELVKVGFIEHVLKNRNKKWIYVIKPGGYAVSKSFKSKIKNILMSIYFRFIKKISNSSVVKMPHSLDGEMKWSDIYYHNSIDKIFSRDIETFQKILRNCKSKIFLASDMAMYYLNKPSKFTSLDTEKKNKVIISLRFDRDDLEPEIAQKLVTLLSNQNKITSEYISQVTFDNDLNKSEAEKYNNIYYQYKIDNESLLNIQKAYSESNFVISNRLHSLLLGLINGSKPIALINREKDKKIIGCLNQLGIKFFYSEDILNNFKEIRDLVDSEEDININFDQIIKEF